MSNDNNNINSKDFLIGSLIGGIVGAATALLLAPKSGKELRSDINEQASIVKERTNELSSTALEKSSEFAEAAKERTENISKNISERSANIMDKVKNVRQGFSKELIDQDEELNRQNEEGSDLEKREDEPVSSLT